MCTFAKATVWKEEKLSGFCLCFSTPQDISSRLHASLSADFTHDLKENSRVCLKFGINRPRSQFGFAVMHSLSCYGSSYKLYSISIFYCVIFNTDRQRIPEALLMQHILGLILCGRNPPTHTPTHTTVGQWVKRKGREKLNVHNSIFIWIDNLINDTFS